MLDNFESQPDQKYIEKFAKMNNLPISQVEESIKNSSNWKLSLDTLALQQSKKVQRPGLLSGTNYISDDLDVKGMRNMTPKDIRSYGKMEYIGKAKEAGTTGYGFSNKGGWGLSVKDANNLSRGEKVKTFARHLNPLGASSMNTLGESVGVTGQNTKALAAKGSLMSKASRRVLYPAFAGLTAYSAFNSEDPLNEFATTVGTMYGMQQGWRIGKSGADAFIPGKSSHFKRIPIGLAGAAAGAAIVGGGIAALGDLGKNDSAITKRVKQFQKRDLYAGIRDTQQSLTLRRSALDKLSSSSLNNRGQLLGNEAAILKNAHY